MLRSSYTSAVFLPPRLRCLLSGILCRYPLLSLSIAAQSYWAFSSFSALRVSVAVLSCQRLSVVPHNMRVPTLSLSIASYCYLFRPILIFVNCSQQQLRVSSILFLRPFRRHCIPTRLARAARFLVLSCILCRFPPSLCLLRLHLMQASALPTIAASITLGYYPNISTHFVLIRGDVIAARSPSISPASYAVAYCVSARRIYAPSSLSGFSKISHRYSPKIGVSA